MTGRQAFGIILSILVRSGLIPRDLGTLRRETEEECIQTIDEALQMERDRFWRHILRALEDFPTKRV